MLMARKKAVRPAKAISEGGTVGKRPSKVPDPPQKNKLAGRYSVKGRKQVTNGKGLPAPMEQKRQEWL
jgi:hypothetical protein